MMKNGRTIRIKSGVVNIPVVEHINTEKEFEASIFTEQYVQALDALNNLVAAQSASSKQSDNRVSPEESPNNIIAFVGERGSGKTSCMSSVAELLAPEKLHEIKSKYTAIEKHQFENIGIIDPSYFDKRTISCNGRCRLQNLPGFRRTQTHRIRMFRRTARIGAGFRPGTTQHAMSAGKKRDNRRV